MAENVQSPKAKRGCFGRILRWSLIVFGVLVGCGILASFLPIKQDVAIPTTAQTLAAVQNTETPNPTEPPTATPLPTETPIPTLTPFPTETPLPTDTPVPPTATPVPTPTPQPTVAWYTGGTLHKATWAEWKSATVDNKLATAADWITNSYEPAWKTEDELRRLSTELVICVDEVADENIQAWGADSLTTNMVVSCILLMMDE